MKKVFVWDLPVRLFHWTIVVLICISFYTGAVGGFEIMDYHMLSGYALITLVIFRIIWGMVGSRHSRFSSFVRGPGTILAYLKAPSSESLGHNPLGALSVLAILTVIVIQVGTGLFANDDIMLEGPLAHLVSYDTSRQLTSIHETNRFVLLGLIVMHLIAVAYYQFYRKHRLIKPMLTGSKEVEEDSPGDVIKDDRLIVAAASLAAAAGLVYYLVNHV